MRRFFVVLGRILLTLVVYIFSLVVLLVVASMLFSEDSTTTATIPTWYVPILIVVPIGLLLLMVFHFRKKGRTTGSLSQNTRNVSKIFNSVTSPCPSIRQTYSVFTVINTQTPNDYNDRLCSLGICRIAEGKIIYTKSFSVNPECHIEESHSMRHGLWDSDVINAQTLPDVWAQVVLLTLDSVLVAHNASFHLAVLGKALNAYGTIPASVKYLDTLELAREYYPDAPRKGLEPLCQQEGISLPSHSALDHARATGELLLRMTGGIVSSQEVHPWAFSNHLNDETYISR